MVKFCHFGHIDGPRFRLNGRSARWLCYRLNKQRLQRENNSSPTGNGMWLPEIRIPRPSKPITNQRKEACTAGKTTRPSPPSLCHIFIPFFRVYFLFRFFFFFAILRNSEIPENFVLQKILSPLGIVSAPDVFGSQKCFSYIMFWK